MLRLRVKTAIVASLILAAVCYGQDVWHTEADRLGALLNWQKADVIAEIGAGKGKLTVVVCDRVGKIFTTELDDKVLANLNELAKNNPNIAVVKGSESETNLPPQSCDSIFMRDVYHHFTKPAEMDKSLFASIKSGGLLAIIDQNPRAGTSVPDGAPANREGHGIPQKLLIKELTDAGFVVEKIDNDWPTRDAYHDIYCVVFRKPKQ
jgi:SAM-dependent methyltransferase